MFPYPAGVFLVVCVVFVAVPLIIVTSVRLFLSILDDNRKVPPHTLRRIH